MKTKATLTRHKKTISYVHCNDEMNCYVKTVETDSAIISLERYSL